MLDACQSPGTSWNNNSIGCTLATARIPPYNRQGPVKSPNALPLNISLPYFLKSLHSPLLCNLFPGSIINPLAIFYSDLRMHTLRRLLHA